VIESELKRWKYFKLCNCEQTLARQCRHAAHILRHTFLEVYRDDSR
jgi:hypothetical protein